MASFSVKSFERKLKEMSSRQDSVQTVSLWLIHHRAHSKTVVSLWHDHIKKAKPDRRLVLFYLANDVIQNSRKKGKEFSSSFGKVLVDAMSYLRDSKIRPSVERVLKIWQERKVFDKEIVQKLIAQLYRDPKSESKVEVRMDEKESKSAKPEKKEPTKPKRPVPADFQVSKAVAAMVTMQELEAESQRRETQVSQMRLDASSSDGIKQLKDRAGGNRFSRDFEESSSKIDELAQSLVRENQHRHILINALEDSDAYYEAALKEATIIANAYRSFGNRLHAMKKKLDNKIRKFATAEKEAPVSAPKASFLKSGLSGILEEVNKSPAGSAGRPNEDEKGKDEEKEKEKDEEKEIEKEEETAKEVKEEKVIDPTIDHVEVADMDIESDSENEGETSETAAPPMSSDSQSNTNGSAVSTPNLTPAAVSPSPKLTTEVPKSTSSETMVSQPPSSSSSSQQFGYTMTVNSSEGTGAVSPASHDSAPSPEGSPELNLEQYEEPGTNIMSSGDINLTTNGSFLARPESNVKGSTEAVETAKEKSGETTDNTEPPATSSQSASTVQLIAQLISKTRRQHNDTSGGSVEDTSNTPLPTKQDGKTGDKPLLSLIDSLFPVLSTSLRTLKGTPGDKVDQHAATQDQIKDQNKEKLIEEDVEQTATDESTASENQETIERPKEGYVEGVASSTPLEPSVSRLCVSEVVKKGDIGHSSRTQANSPKTDAKHVPLQTGHSTKDANGKILEGDNTPEHGSETPDIGEAAPIIIRSGSSYPSHAVVSDFNRYTGPVTSHGRVFADHPVISGRQPFSHHERLHSSPRNSDVEPTILMRDEVRRTSGDESVLDERYPRDIRSSGMRSPGGRSPRIAPPPMDWERWPPRRDVQLRDRFGTRHENDVVPQSDRREDFRAMEGPKPFPSLERRESFRPVDGRGEFQQIERREEEFHPIERPGNILSMENRPEFASVERRGEFRPLENQKEFPPMERPGEVRPMDGRKELLPVDRPVEVRTMDGRKELPPVDRPVEVHTMDGRQEFPPVDRTGEFPPREGKGTFCPMEGRKEFPPMERPGESRTFEGRKELHPPEMIAERRPVDGRIEFHLMDRQEDFHHVERRENFRNIRPVGRGVRGHGVRVGPQRGQNRPGPYHGPMNMPPYRAEQTSRGFRTRFPHPPAYRMGGPRAFGEVRLKRPGPPFNPEPPKRPHF